jgi:hypothetical protein
LAGPTGGGQAPHAASALSRKAREMTSHQDLAVIL